MKKSSATPATSQPRTRAQKKKSAPPPRPAKAQPPRAARASGARAPQVHQADAAGIDLGSRQHYVALPPGRATPHVRCFGTTTPELRELVAWLQEHGIKTVAMEATGVYWQPLYGLLEEAGVRPVLVDAFAVKNVPGRKSDVQDCQWLQQLHSYGLLRAAFVPAAEIRALRRLVRHRQNLVDASADDLRHVQKALEEMNLPLHHVLSDISGASALRMLDAIVKGERDPQKLAALADPRVKASGEQIAQALRGEYLEEELFVLGQTLESYRHKAEQLERCDQIILAHLKKLPARVPAAETPATAAVSDTALGGKRPRHRTEHEKTVATQLHRILGLDLTLIPGLGVLAVLTLLAEIGLDLSAWRSAKAFASWLGLCPNRRISGGRVLSTRTRKVVHRLATMLRMAAMAAGKTDTALGAFYRRKRAQLGAPKANTATARKLAVLIYHLLQRQEPYRAQPLAVYEAQQRERQLEHLRRKASHLGYDLQERPAA